MSKGTCCKMCLNYECTHEMNMHCTFDILSEQCTMCLSDELQCPLYVEDPLKAIMLVRIAEIHQLRN